MNQQTLLFISLLSSFLKKKFAWTKEENWRKVKKIRLKNEGNEVTANNRRGSVGVSCRRDQRMVSLNFETVVRLPRRSALCNNASSGTRAIFKRAAFVDPSASSTDRQRIKISNQFPSPLFRFVIGSPPFRVTLSSNESVRFRFNRPVKGLSFFFFYHRGRWKMKRYEGEREERNISSKKNLWNLKRDKLFLLEIVVSKDNGEENERNNRRGVM